jgi:hypothetical protein
LTALGASGVVDSGRYMRARGARRPSTSAMRGVVAAVRHQCDSRRDAVGAMLARAILAPRAAALRIAMA